MTCRTSLCEGAQGFSCSEKKVTEWENSRSGSDEQMCNFQVWELWQEYKEYLQIYADFPLGGSICPWGVNMYPLQSMGFLDLGGFQPISDDREKLSFSISQRFFFSICVLRKLFAIYEILVF